MDHKGSPPDVRHLQTRCKNREGGLAIRSHIKGGEVTEMSVAIGPLLLQFI
jgi:hypothetical protein